MRPWLVVCLATAAGAGLLGVRGLHGQQHSADDVEELRVDHSQCSYFVDRERFTYRGLRGEQLRDYELSHLTEQVTKMLPRMAASEDGAPRRSFEGELGTIDRFLLEAMKEAGATPAPKTNDFEFIRRVTLDLTGRVPRPLRVQQFVASIDSGRRAAYIEELLNSAEWVDKWTQFFGDLFRNTARLDSTSLVRFAEGRNAFHQWIKASLAANKPYNKMAQELIAARGGNSWEQGELNWILAGRVTGGPVQDTFDQMAANTAKTFLGISDVNCILCHNGRGHMDDLSLWGKSATRYQGYQLASFFSRTRLSLVRVGSDPQPYYWGVQDSLPTDYQLNTTTGNRPPRTPIGTERVVAPAYPFNGNAPPSGQNYREFLGRELTQDIQFARATVNYIWKEFMGRGLVEPVDQFDLARLDPDNPPRSPWKLQPSNARLLNALAQEFQQSGFDLKWLMRQITNSEAYQITARYPGRWDPAWQNLFARKLVRRLWAEELHDALTQTSNIPATYNVRGTGVFNWAMQFPEPTGFGGAFLDSFYRGDRDDEPRRQDGSVFQALHLMNDPFVNSRTKATGSGSAASLLQQNLPLTDAQLVSNLYLTVLSRYPTAEERQIALASLQPGNGLSRTQKAEHLLWTLYNKVDFIFNY